MNSHQYLFDMEGDYMSGGEQGDGYTKLGVEEIAEQFPIEPRDSAEIAVGATLALAESGLPVDVDANLDNMAMMVIGEFPDLESRGMEDDGVTAALADFARLNNFDLPPEQWEIVKSHILNRLADKQWVADNVSLSPDSM